jgi:hypothetical protein
MRKARYLSLALVVVLCFSVLTSLMSVQASAQGLDFHVFLPSIIHEEQATGCDIRGQVEVDGSFPNEAVPLVLRRFDGTSATNIMTITTSVEGEYEFLNVPPLATEDSNYRISFLNRTFNENWLSQYVSAPLTGCAPGDQIEYPAFDLYKIELLSPGIGATVSLPTTFTWQRRPATPTDNYRFWVGGGDPFVQHRLDNLGYVDQVTLDTLPPSFEYGDYYSWYMDVRDPQGGTGYSFGRRIFFTDN